MKHAAVSGFGIHLKVADFDKSSEFYRSLGFQPVFAYGNEDFRVSLPNNVPSAPERYRGMTFKLGEDATLEIAEGHIAVPQREVFKETITSPKISAMIKVASLIPILQNPLIKITFPVRHYYWGTIEAVTRDPDGLLLVFIAPFSEKEMSAVQKIYSVEVIQPGT